jgi:hypothetical protein
MTLRSGNLWCYCIDDSGAEDAGILTNSWIAFEAAHATFLMREWRALRHRLRAEYGVPVTSYLHASSARVPAVELVLSTIGNNPVVRLGTIYRHTDKKGAAFYQEKLAVFGKLITCIDTAVAARGGTAVLFVDGKGSNRLRQEYQTLRPQGVRTLEFKPAKKMQLLQAADIVAWTAYQNIAQHHGKELVSAWYDTYLRPRDVHGGPVAVLAAVPGR